MAGHQDEGLNAAPRGRTGVLFAFVLALALLLFLIDTQVPLGLVVLLGYLPLLLVTVAWGRPRHYWLMAVAASGLIVLGHFVSPPAPLFNWIEVHNRALAIAAIWIVSAMGRILWNTRFRLLEQHKHYSRTLADSLAESEARAAELKAIFDSLNQPVLVFNDLGKPVRANRAAYELLAADPCALNPDAYLQLSNLLRTRHLDGSLVDPTELPSRRALLGETVKGQQLMLTNAKGRDIIIETAGIPLRVSGRLIGAVAVWNDITERTRIERERELLLASERAARCEAEHANRVKDEFVATLSHELRTPLNAILGWAQLLRRRRPDPEDVKEALEVIQSNALAQKQLIDDLLDVSRMMSGKIRLNRRALNVSHAAAEALASIRPQAEEKGLRLEEAIEHEAGCVQADPERLQQILWNLLSNAVKFTPAGGQIRFAVERQGQNAVLTVSDTGIGIRPEFLPSLFERFRQADASTTRRYRGLGLGLSLVKQLVDLHGGSISASSPGENQGTTFTLTLPLIIGPVMECPATAAGGGGDDGEPETTLQGLRVLIVDDLADARELLSRLFREYSAAPIAVASAAAALEQIRKAPPDVLVSDISMPDEDGYSLISKVRALPAERLARIPAIAVTAFARPEDRNQAIRAGFQAHVSKPVDPAELIALVAGLSGRTPRRKKA